MRIIEFFGHIDWIPEHSKFLYCKEIELPLSDEEITQKTITGEDNRVLKTVTVFYYQVTDYAYDQLLKNGFFRKSISERSTEWVEEVKKY